MKVTEENFNEMIASGKPVMVDFGATWCGPCKALAPRIEEIEKEYEGRAVIGTADVDECSDLAAQFRLDTLSLLPEPRRPVNPLTSPFLILKSKGSASLLESPSAS